MRNDVVFLRDVVFFADAFFAGAFFAGAFFADAFFADFFFIAFINTQTSKASHAAPKNWAQ
ncbi:MAG TPA: hypothetical protein VN936_07165 [Candidatus Acidoferrum sp.]|nr:hypothetical protein [Candidatus Acidoferrum sp.]